MIYLVFIASFITACVSLYLVGKDRFMALTGAALYTLMPYRIYICFDKKDMGQALFWAVVPLAIACLVMAYKCKKKLHKFIFLFVSAVMLALLALTDAPVAIVGYFVLMLAGLMLKKYWYIPVALVSLIGSVVVNMPYWRFILLGHINSEAVESALIASRGYYFGKYFMSWLYFDSLPGLGLGLFLALIMIGWHLINVTNASQEAGTTAVFIEKKGILKLVLLSAILAAMAFHWGIWDIAERIHPIFERFISSIESPNVLFGYGCMVLCIPSAFIMREFWNSKKPIIAKLIPMFIMGMNVFTAVFQIVSNTK